MRVLLINARSDFHETGNFEPLELGYLASYLNAHGHEATFIKQMRRGNIETDRHVLDEVASYRPDLIGFSSVYFNWHHSLRLANILKAGLGVPIVFGGNFPSSHPEICLEQAIDFVVIGEGEQSLLALVNHLDDPLRHESIPGLAVERNGKVHQTPRFAPLEDLDALPFPLRKSDPAYLSRLSDMIWQRRHARPVVGAISMSRGCVYNCAFCCNNYMWDRQYRKRSAASIERELLEMKTTQELRLLHVYDQDVCFDREVVLGLSEILIQHFPSIHWTSEASVLSACRLSEPDAKKMYASGCRSLYLGFENAADSILKTLPKRYERQEAIRATRMLAKNGINVIGGFIFGFPQDTWSTAWENIRFVHSLDALLALAVLRPYRGTTYYSYSIDRGWLLEKDEDRLMNRHYPVVRTHRMSKPEVFAAILFMNLFSVFRSRFHFRLLWKMIRALFSSG